MNGSHIDYGVRCAKHRAHIFLPRCPACQSLTAEYRTLHLLEEPVDAA